MSVTPELSNADGAADPGVDGSGTAPVPQRRERWPKVVAVVAAAALVAFVAYAVTSANSRKASPAVVTVAKGKAAPAFSLPRLGGGARVSLASFRGLPTVVNFFASWCQNCRAELNAFGAVSNATKGRVNFVGIDTDETSEAAARRLLAAAGATYPVGLDPNGNVASGKYFVNGLPVTYFLDAKGRVVGETFGSQNTASLERWMTLLEKGSTGS